MTRALARISSLLAVLGSLGGPAADAQAATGDTFIITGGTVILEPGKRLDRADVVVRRGRIEAVGANLARPSDALELAADGLIVHAGLINGGSAVGYDPAQRRSFAGPATPFDAQASANAVTPTDDRRLMTPEFQVAAALVWNEDELETWRLRGFTDRLVVPAGGILAGQSAVVSLAGPPTQAAILRARALTHLRFQAQPGQYPATLMGMIAHLRQTLSDAEYARRANAMLPVESRGGVDPALAALWPVQDQKRRLAIAADTEDEIHRAIALADEFRLRVAIYGGREAHKVATLLKSKDVPVLFRLDLPAEPPRERPRPSQPRKESAAKAEPQPKEAPDHDVPLRVLRHRHRQWLDEIQGIKTLQDAGVLVALALGDLKPDDFSKQLGRLVEKGGLSAEAVLELLTTAPARAFEVENEIGRVAPGRRAHLVIRKGLPTDKDTWVAQVLIGDKLFDYGRLPEKPAEAKKEPNKEDSPKPAEREDGGAIASELDSDRRPRLHTGGTVLIRGGHLVTVAEPRQAGDLPQTDLLVRNGRIAEIGRQLPAPAGVAVIDAAGKFIMPGIIDAHSHMAITGGTNESTLSITSEVRVKDVVDSKDLTIYRALAGGVTTARLLHGSANVIGGQDAVIKLKYGRPARELILHDAPQGIKFALGENVKRARGRFPNSRLGVEATLVRAFAEARQYQQHSNEAKTSGRDAQGTPGGRRDYRLEALAGVLSGKLQMHCHCYRADEILMLLRVADQFHFKVRSLQHGLEAYKVAPEVARHGASIATFSDWWAYKWEAYDAIPYNTALLLRAGVNTCLKSDSPQLVRHMYQEAAKLLRYGVDDPNAALAAITLTAAEQLGLDNRIGSLEVGKEADLAIFNGHPLNSYSRCVMTLIEGEVYFEERERELTPAPPADVSAESAGAGGNRAPRPADLGLRLPAPAARQRRLSLDPSPGGVYALVNATIVPVESPPIPRGTVLVRAGQIAAVGADLRPPPEAKIIDCTGLVVYPGLIDAGTKVGLLEVKSASETIDFNETGVLQPDLRASTAVNPDSEIIPVTRAGGVTCALTIPMGGVISGQSALIQLAGWVPAEMVLLESAALHLRLPPPQSERPAQPFTGRGRFASLRARQLQEVRLLFRRAEQYHRAKAEAQRRGQPAPLLDPRLEALGPYLAKQRPVIVRADTAAEIREAVALAEELHVRLIVSGARDAWKVTELLKMHDVPLIIGPVMTLVGAPHDPYHAPFSNAAKLYRAGVRFCIQTDETTNSRNLPLEAAMAVSYGLPADEALRAVTIHPARILGVEGRLGGIVPGKTANLVIADGDVLQAWTQIKGLFIAGQPLEPASKQTRLRDRYARRLEQLESAPEPPTPQERPRTVPK